MTGVAGFPVRHSRSPVMMAAALAELGLDWRYVPLPLSPERFADTVRALPASGYTGINVTVPHKVAALGLADSASSTAVAIGAANTLTFRAGAITADNTDAGGFMAALGEDPRGRAALVLGAGGAARAVAWALREAGARVAIWNRTGHRAADLAGELGVRHAESAESAEIVVNATSVGLDPATGEAAALETLGLTGSRPPATFADLVYGERPTALERWAGRAGGRVVSGLETLVHQGALSLELWSGREAPVETMRNALRSGAGAQEQIQG
jgi:shikimate dehydrogenase